MEQPPALTHEEVTRLSAIEYANLGQPQTVKVFGIMHVIFGGFGALMIAWTTFVMIFGNPMLKWFGNSPQFQMQASMESEMMPYTLFSTIILVILTALILIAGVLLLKKRKNAIKWSNYYAWVSIAAKIINLVISILVMVPMTKKMMSTLPPASSGAVLGGFGIMMIVSMVVGFIITLIYPTLTLILLNRPYVKTWFANQPR
jgi:hypothetical protein